VVSAFARYVHTFLPIHLSLICLYRLPKIKAWVDENNPGDLIIPFCANLEQRLSVKKSTEEKEAMLQELETTSVLPKIIVAGYQTLQLIYFFTCGPDEVRAWTIRVSINGKSVFKGRRSLLYDSFLYRFVS